MNQRWLGAAVVAVVLLAAIVAPNWSTHRVAGSPVAKVLAGPPASGDCVTSMNDPWRQFTEPAPDGAELMDYPSAIVGPCSGTVVGEVVSVNSVADPPIRIAANDYLSDYSTCALDAIGYTGSIPPVVQRSDGQQGILWLPRLNFRYTTVGPNRAQRAAGQQWTACVIGPDDGLPYAGRLQNVLTAGVLPAAFGTCLSSTDLTQSTAISCARPHPVEILGSTVLGPLPVPGSELQRACVVFAGRAMRTADPTRSGAIRVQAVALDRLDAVILPTDSPLRDMYVACIASAQDGVLFDNSLVGVADGPLPVG